MNPGAGAKYVGGVYNGDLHDGIYFPTPLFVLPNVFLSQSRESIPPETAEK